MSARAFWFGYLVIILDTLLWAWSALADEFRGLMCRDEAASEAVAIAYSQEGFDLEDAIASALVETGRCMRIEGAAPSYEGAIVYRGKVIGNKMVVGVGKQEGKPELYGLRNYPFQEAGAI
jgi:hypothetical protein